MAQVVCVHCMEAPSEENDHVLPRAWYPDGTDPRVQRLTVPACRSCGAKLKKAEEQTALMIVMTRGFDRDHEAALGVYERIRKSWNAIAAKTAREREKRADRLYSILGRAHLVVPAPHEGVGAVRVPVRTPSGLIVNAAVALRFRSDDFAAVVGKFVRGLHYHRQGVPLPARTSITAFNPPSEVVTELLAASGGSLSEALHYRVASDEAGRMVWCFLLWGQVNIGGVVELPHR